MTINQIAIAAFATLLSTGGSLVAQQPAPPTQEAASRQQQGASEQIKDQTFAKCLAIANKEQVTLAGFAKTKATNEEVKQYAIALEKAHQGCLEKLTGISTQSGSNNKTVPSTTTTAATNNPSGVDFLQLNQEISTQCLKDSQEYLSQKKGADFDKCFVAMQVAKHAGMHSTLTVLQRHTTGKLQGIIKESLEMNGQHLQGAMKLMEQLAGQDSSKSGQISN